MAKPRPLTIRQQLFCWHQARTDEPAQAAIRAGYSSRSAEREAFRLLSRQEILTEVDRCRREARKHRADIALAGLIRLATGGVGDAAKLACRDAPPGEEELSAMDLFAVSELRRGKDGGLEIKLHDRLKALELLLNHCADPEQETASLYTALDAAVSAMGGTVGAGCEHRAL